MMGLKEDIRAKTNNVLGSVTVKSLGKTIHIRELSVGDRIFATRENGPLPSEIRTDEVTGDEVDVYSPAKFALIGACDASGQRIWSNEDFDDVLAMTQEQVHEIANAVARFNKLDEESLGNSPESRTDASPTGSASD